jgi:tetratricopeptide (TPR) repeat protein
MTVAGTSGEAEGQPVLALYQQGLVRRMAAGVEFIRRHQHQPEQIQAHVLSLLTLVNNARWNPATAGLWAELVERLHPYPLLWGYAELWETHLRRVLQEAPGSLTDFQKSNMVIYLAETLYDARQLEMVCAWAEQAREAACLGKNPLALARAGLLVARVFNDREDGSRAEAHLIEVEAQVRDLCKDVAPERQQLALAYLQILRADMLRAQGSAQAALALYDQVVKDLSVNPGEEVLSYPQYWLLRGEVHEARGVLSWARGDYPAASDDLNAATQIFAQQADHLREASVLANLGLIYWKMCQFDRAEQAQLQSIAIREARNAQGSLARVTGDLGMVYFLRGNMAQACHYMEVSRNLAQRYGDTRSVALSAANLSGIRVFQGQSGQVVDKLEQALFSSRERSKEHELGVILDITPCYWNLGRVEQAEQTARRTFEIALELREEIPGVMVAALRALALVQPREQAVVSLREALRLSVEHERKFDRAACLLSLAGLQAAPESDQTWQAGTALLAEMGASAWVEGRSSANPPFLPMVV